MLLITQPRVGRSHNEIIALQMAAGSLGWEIFPSPGSWRMPDELLGKKIPGVPYGSQLFCEVISQQMGWKLKANPFDWLTKIPKKYLKRQVDFMTLAEAKKIGVRKFIKPADDKCFDAKVYEPGEFQPAKEIEDNYPTLVSDIVEFTHEYRCFVRDRKVVTAGSCYIWESHIAEPREFENLVPNLEYPEDFLNDVLFSTECENSVVDIGLIDGKDWAVIETNPCWASGLYGSDPVEALLTMEKAVEMEK